MKFVLLCKLIIETRPEMTSYIYAGRFDKRGSLWVTKPANMNNSATILVTPAELETRMVP